MDATRLFSRIYTEDAWNGGSGPGSDVAFCKPLVEWLVGYIFERGCNSLLDLGCGDFRWMPEVLERTGIQYTGLDVVPWLVSKHAADHPLWNFAVLDASIADPAALPTADLYFAKDVLQHWETPTIERFLDRFFAARPSAHLVVCNCDGQTVADRRLDARWHFAPLAGGLPPLVHYRPERLFAWSWKAVYRLHQRSPANRLATSLSPRA